MGLIKNLIVLSSLLMVSLAWSETPSYICHLSISAPGGEGSLCNAVHVGQGRLLSASHCFPNGQKTISQGIILASCGAEEFMEFTSLKNSNSYQQGGFNEDISLLEFSSLIKADSVAPTNYPSMYIEGGQLRNGVECEVLALRGNYPSMTLKRIKVDKSMDLKVMNNAAGPAQILMQNKSGAPILQGRNVLEGDSGGALVCRYSKFAREELVGVVMSYGRARDTREIRYNSFSPVFGPEAKRLLNN
jgi:hypothetical protein